MAVLAAAAQAGLAAPLSAPPSGQTVVKTPSGLEVTWLETIQGARGPDGLTTRFRFLAPAIAGGEAAGLDTERVLQDMQWLCDSYALPRLASTGPRPAQIVISLSDRPVPFGDSDPDVTQFFEAYSPGSPGATSCEWEMF